MRVKVEIDENLEDEIIIKCPKITDDIKNIIKLLSEQNKLLVKNHKEEKLISINSIYRVDTVDDKVFIYTEKEVFETNHKLYELDTMLPHDRFIRINKSGIINVFKIESLKTDLSRRIKITLLNGDKEVVNRSYIDGFKGLMNSIKRRASNEKNL